MKVSMPRGLFRSGSVRPVRTLVALVALAGLAAGTAACNDDVDRPAASASPSALRSGSAPPVDVLTESRALVERLYQGTYRPPDPTVRIAAKAKKIALLSPSQASPSAAIPVNAAAEAAEALGWTATVLDMQYDPRRAAGLVRDAINAGVDAIISAVDCGYAPDAFAEAKTKGILIAPLFAFDCTDPTVAGAPGPSQFTTFVNWGDGQIDNAKSIAAAGSIAASVLIAATNGTAKVLSFTDPTSTILTYTNAGFLAQMARCTGCKVLESVNLVSAEGPAALQAKVRDALARHPDANAIRSSHSSATQQFIAPALVASGRQNDVIVVGGEGQDKDLDLIRTKQGLNFTLNTDTAWFGWTVVDTVNSAFNGEKPRPNGLGGMLVDKDHNLPPSGPVQHNVNYKNVYRKAWGVG
jgi:ribose transport system substrate-binding protein